MENLLSIEETAQRLKTHPETVRRYLREGQIAGVKLGGRSWRVRESDLTAFIAPRVIPARTKTRASENPLAKALAKVQARDKANTTPKLRTAGIDDAASELRQMREEQTP
jgi:excisionase family DNA binding protein